MGNRETCTVNECRKISHKAYCGEYKCDGRGWKWEHFAKEVSIDTIHLQCDSNDLSVEYWPKFYDYIRSELDQGRKPVIKVDRIGKLPIRVYYGDNCYYYCSVFVCTMIIGYTLAALAMMFG